MSASMPSLLSKKTGQQETGSAPDLGGGRSRLRPRTRKHFSTVCFGPSHLEVGREPRFRAMAEVAAAPRGVGELQPGDHVEVPRLPCHLVVGRRNVSPARGTAFAISPGRGRRCIKLYDN